MARKSTPRKVAKKGYRFVGSGKSQKQVKIGSTADFVDRGKKAARTRKRNLAKHNG